MLILLVMRLKLEIQAKLELKIKLLGFQKFFKVLKYFELERITSFFETSFNAF